MATDTFRAARAVLRALTALVIGWLAARGAVGLWQQFALPDAPLEPVATNHVPVAESEATSRIPVAAPDAPTLMSAAGTVAPIGTAGAAPQPAPAATPQVVAWRTLESSASFVEGHAGPVVAALFDPDCGVCSQLWRRVRAPIAAGRLRVRWIPVAIVSAASAPRGAALLRAADPVAALAAHESRAPGREIHAAQMAEGLDDVAANTALLSLLTAGRPATPVLAAMTGSRAPELLIGMPADLDLFLDRAR